MRAHTPILRTSIVATLAALALGGSALSVAQAAPATVTAMSQPAALSQAQPRIIDGTVATENPGAVILLWKYQKDGKDAWWHQCTGSVIAPQWILLAKHCILERQVKELNRFVVRAGSLKDEEGGETSTFTNFFTYSSSNARDKRDLMLIKLATPFSAAIKPVTLATQDPPLGVVNTVYGWGTIDAGATQVSSVLKMAEITTSLHTMADNDGGPSIRSNRKNGIAWKGDSGGPQFYNGTQVGVISTVETAKQTFMNSSSVAQSLGWIQETMKKNS